MVQILLRKEKDPYFFHKVLILLLFSHCALEFPLS